MTPLLLAGEGGGVGCRRFPGEFSNTCIVERIEHLWPEVITNPRSDAGLSDMVDHDARRLRDSFFTADIAREGRNRARSQDERRRGVVRP